MAAASANNKLEEARRKLRPFSFDNLPLDRNDGIWTEFRNPPYSLDLEELSALKNARCTPGNVSRPVKFIELLLFKIAFANESDIITQLQTLVKEAATNAGKQ